MAQRLFGGVFPVFGWAGGPLGGSPSGSFEARLKRVLTAHLNSDMKNINLDKQLFKRKTTMMRKEP